MIRPDWLLLAGLLAALPAQAGESLDAEFLAFLAEEADEAETDAQAPELVAWLRDWWTPADNAENRPEEKP